MSEKTREKKDGQDPNKKAQAMREDVQERKEHPKEHGQPNDNAQEENKRESNQ